MLRRLTALAFALAGPAQALEPLPPDDFLDVAIGKTLYFYNVGSDGLAGLEQFVDRETSIWKPGGQECYFGRIVTFERKICFQYEGIPQTDGEGNCWWMFLDDGKIIARPARISSRGMQYIGKVSEQAVSCPNAPSS